MDTPEISVIIVNHNAADYVRRAIASLHLASQQHPYETIVIDNSDKPDPIREADYWKGVDNNGFGTACNEGAQQARGRLLLFLNPDAELNNSALDLAAEYYDTHPETGLMGIRTLLPDGSFESGCLRGFPTPFRAACYFAGLEKCFPHSRIFGGYHMTWLDRGQTAYVDCVSGSFMLISKELFTELKGFDETFFMYGEDLDICLRVHEAGRKVVYFAGGSMLHHHGKCGSSERQTSAFYDSMWLFYQKHYQKKYSRFTAFMVRSAVEWKKRRALRRLGTNND